MNDPREIAQRIVDAIWDKCCSPPDDGFDTTQAITECSAILAAEMPRQIDREQLATVIQQAHGERDCVEHCGTSDAHTIGIGPKAARDVADKVIEFLKSLSPPKERA